jgi:hypothetical protein
VYNIIHKFREWLTINCVVDVAKTTLPRFYIFNGKRIRDNYIQFYKPKTYMAMQSKAWMTTYLSKDFFFQEVKVVGISLTNRHLFILDGHGSHDTLKAIEWTKEFGLERITLLSHTSHILPLLDVGCCKPFKITFKREKYNNG